MPVVMTGEEQEFSIRTGDPTEIEVVEPGELEVGELWDRFHTYNDQFIVLGRKSVQEAWLAGHILCGLKEMIPHGEWLNALEEQDIANQTANRYMRLRRAYDEIPQVEEFDSITQAMKALQPRKEDLWTEVDDSVGGVASGGTTTPPIDEEDEDASWEVMQSAVGKAQEAFDLCDDTMERYGLASIFLGWLADLNEEMKTAIVDYGRPEPQEDEE